MTPDESQLESFIASRLAPDPAHDLAHVCRVVENARHLATLEGADLAVVMPAAWLHDCVSLPKNHPDRHLASRQAAAMAIDFLRAQGTDDGLLPAIAHARPTVSAPASRPPHWKRRSSRTPTGSMPSAPSASPAAC